MFQRIWQLRIRFWKIQPCSRSDQKQEEFFEEDLVYHRDSGNLPPPLVICGTICGNGFFDNLRKDLRKFCNLRKALGPKKQFAESQQNSTICGKQETGSGKFSPAALKIPLESVICELQIPKLFSPAASYFCKAPQAKIYRFIPLYNGDFNRKISTAGEFLKVYTALQRRFLWKNGRRRRTFLGLYCSTTEISIEKLAPQAKKNTF